MTLHEPPAVPPADPVGQRLADILQARIGPVDTYLTRALRQLGQIDRAVYTAVAATPTPELDKPVRWLSRNADHSRIWLGIAAGIAVLGGRPGRRAAVHGVLTVCVTSAVVNLGIKSAWLRRRPDRISAGVPQARHVTMPASSSFPSGHSASGFAFAASIGRDMPSLALPLRFLAGAVAYSRVHTGVHYPGDVVIGSIIGAGIAQAIAGPTERTARAARSHWPRHLPHLRHHPARGMRAGWCRGQAGNVGAGPALAGPAHGSEWTAGTHG